MSVLRPAEQQEWLETVEFVGFSGIVASVMPEAMAKKCVEDSQFLHRTGKFVASQALGFKPDQLVVDTIEDPNFGLHYDVQGAIPELSMWLNLSGDCEWKIKSGGSRDKDELNQEIDKFGIETSRKVAASCSVVNAKYDALFERIAFNGVGGLVFAAGLSGQGHRIPAMHQVTGSADRQSLAVYGKVAD